MNPPHYAVMRLTTVLDQQQQGAIISHRRELLSFVLTDTAPRLLYDP